MQILDLIKGSFKVITKEVSPLYGPQKCTGQTLKMITFLWAINFKYFTIAHNTNSIRVNYSVQSVSYRNNGALFEFSSNCFLD